MRKKMIVAASLVGVLLLATPVLNVDATKKEYITSAYVGTYNTDGAEPVLQNGWFAVIINSIADDGGVILQVDKGGMNGSPLYQSNIIATQINGKKAKFDWEDTWGNRGKGTVVFKKNGQLALTMKETETASMNRSSLSCNKLIMTKYTEKNEVFDNLPK